MEKLSDQWQTPQWLFDELNKEFNFDIDLCATGENSKCQQFYIDYLNDIKLDFAGSKEYRPLKHKYNCAFMNPPYSNPKPFIEKAWEDSKHCKIVCLVKCDPSTKWWATFWNYKYYEKHIFTLGLKDQSLSVIIEAGPKPGCEVRFFSKRIKFDPPEGFGGKVSSNAFPCALVIMDRRNV